MPQKQSRKAAWAVFAAVSAVALLLVLFFLTQKPSEQKDGIILPDSSDTPQQGAVSGSNTESEPNNNQFLEVTNKNVLGALQSLSRPSAYRQIYQVSVGSDDVIYEYQVMLWAKGTLLHAEVSDGTQVRQLISDGNTAYIWYDNDQTVVSVTLDHGMNTEDLLGLPDFDSYLTLTQDEVVDSEYLFLEDAQIPCIYVCAQQDSQYSSRYWISLNTGLLFRSDVLENSNRVYEIRQQLYETLALEDEIFDDRFILPDGSAPFTAASKMLQP